MLLSLRDAPSLTSSPQDDQRKPDAIGWALGAVAMNHVGKGRARQGRDRPRRQVTVIAEHKDQCFAQAEEAGAERVFLETPCTIKDQRGPSGLLLGATGVRQGTRRRRSNRRSPAFGPA